MANFSWLWFSYSRLFQVFSSTQKWPDCVSIISAAECSHTISWLDAHNHTATNQINPNISLWCSYSGLSTFPSWLGRKYIPPHSSPHWCLWRQYLAELLTVLPNTAALPNNSSRVTCLNSSQLKSNLTYITSILNASGARRILRRFCAALQMVIV